MSNFFNNATRIFIDKAGRNMIVRSSNPELIGNIEKTLKRIGFVCNTDGGSAITVTNTERYLPPVFFMTEVKEALLKSGYTLGRGARVAADFNSAQCDSPELNGAFSNIIRSLEVGKTATACA